MKFVKRKPKSQPQRQSQKLTPQEQESARQIEETARKQLAWFPPSNASQFFPWNNE